jgi:uroporphyrinogen III methyltransferase / synthase
MMQTPIKSIVGKRILVTRPRGQAKALSGKLEALGAKAIEIPTIEITDPINYDHLDDAIHDLMKYDWIIFTSAQGVRFFIRRMATLKIPTKILNDLKVAAIGSATAAELKTAGKEANFIPETYLSERIASDIGDVSGLLILLPRADIASKKLPYLLRQRGAIVNEVAAYRTIIPLQLTRDLLIEVLESGIDLVTFTSPSTVYNFIRILDGKFSQKNVKIACIGPVTSRTAEKLGINVNAVAKVHTVEALVEAIINEIG